MSWDRAVIFANGVMEGRPGVLEISPEKDLIICADGGLARALEWNLTPHIVVGDLDSADPVDLKRLSGQGVEIRRHPRDKDETDLELALFTALEHRPGEIIILGAFGRRLDMTLANVLLPAAARLFPGPTGQAGPPCRLLDRDLAVFFVRGPARVSLGGEPGDTVSLLPLEAPVTGVTLGGMKYPLNEATLTLGSTHGISNVVQEPDAWVEVREGGLLAVVSRGEA